MAFHSRFAFHNWRNRALRFTGYILRIYTPVMKRQTGPLRNETAKRQHAEPQPPHRCDHGVFCPHHGEPQP